jgi:mannose-6-phosphate isomerase
VKPAPLRIEPIFSPRIWGARSLAPLFPKKSNLSEPIGEAWLTGPDCRIASGPFEGKPLGAVWKQMPADWRGARLAATPEFPILVKFIFPKNKLSIQVHPDDAYASVHERAAGGRGKTEMWHAVSAEPGAKVLVGLKPDVSREKFLKSLQAHTLEALFEAHSVNAGDTFFVPAGMPHTIGPGMVICEVQQYSDLTYRVYDYGRTDAMGNPRELHIEKALEVIDFESSHVPKVVAVALASEGANSKSLLAACSYFASERWEFRATVQTESDAEQFELWIILAGSGYIHWHGSPLAYGPGQCWFVPANLGRYSLQPEQSSAVIRTYVPDIATLRRELRRSGASQTDVAQAVFDS